MKRCVLVLIGVVALFMVSAIPSWAGDVVIETYRGDVITAKCILNLGDIYKFRYKGNRINFPLEKMKSLHCKDERGNGRMVLMRKDGKSFEFTGSNAGIVSDWKQGSYSRIRYEFEDEVTESVTESWVKSDKVRTIRFK